MNICSSFSPEEQTGVRVTQSLDAAVSWLHAGLTGSDCPLILNHLVPPGLYQQKQEVARYSGMRKMSFNLCTGILGMFYAHLTWRTWNRGPGHSSRCWCGVMQDVCCLVAFLWADWNQAGAGELHQYMAALVWRESVCLMSCLRSKKNKTFMNIYLKRTFDFSFYSPSERLYVIINQHLRNPKNLSDSFKTRSFDKRR